MKGKMKAPDLTNKCGTCQHFKPKEGTAKGGCLKQKLDPEIAPDKENPYGIVKRTQGKCRYYGRSTQT